MMALLIEKRSPPLIKEIKKCTSYSLKCVQQLVMEVVWLFHTRFFSIVACDLQALHVDILFFQVGLGIPCCFRENMSCKIKKKNSIGKQWLKIRVREQWYIINHFPQSHYDPPTLPFFFYVLSQFKVLHIVAIV